MHHFVFFTLAQHNEVIQRAWNLLAIGLILVSNFGTLAVPARAVQRTAQPAAIPVSQNTASANTNSAVSRQFSKAAASAQPPAARPDKLALKLSADPKFITGPGAVIISWKIKGSLPANTPITLQVTLADGYIPDPTLTYDITSHLLTLPVTGTSGQFTLNAVNPVDAISFPASLQDASGQSLADTALFLPKHEKFSIKKNALTGAGQAPISARKGKIKVSFGTGSLSEDATVEIGAPAGDSMPDTTLSGNPFEIDAQSTQSKQDLHQFSGSISIDVNYSDLNLQGQQESNLYLYWYNPVSKDWEALPTLVDPITKTLHAISTHFSVFDTGINNWQATRVPTVDAFQVSQFTGAASYSMPIEVPAGPGGLQPNLSLSYNSQVIDQSTAQTQASWVGMGWSLGMNSIELNDRGTNPMNTPGNWDSDDTWSINVNGVSSTIVKNGYVYHTADENFMQILYTPSTDPDPQKADSWTVWDKTGNSYFFSKRVKTVYKNTIGGCGYQLVTYE